jgi:uncharacterized membrane protein YkvA (DUF1232 family)
MKEKLEKYYRDIDTLELKALVEKKLEKTPPTMEYVRNLILDVKLLLRILLDEDFPLKEDARKDMISALLYFVEPRDSIPDFIPIIGLWDDYKLVRHVKEKHREEIERYFESTPFFVANYF